ncbi:MAG: Hpt sensor hybrid histidine kinase [Tardiphaga sp.]|nr:Hpt sensor hybrid histidine kinase [Tardiphaga sp.]
MTQRPTRILVVSVGFLIVALVAMSTVIASNLRDEAIRGAVIDLNRHTMTLAVQAERSLQSIDLILSNVNDHLYTQGVFDSASYGVAMGGENTFLFLRDKLAGLPQLEAISMINADGRLINFSRYWPIPDVNVSDRDYFIDLSRDVDQKSFISRPVKNRGTGAWNIYIARRVDGLNGKFAGLILAAMSLQYFEEVYRSVSPGEGSAQSLVRNDGTMLARYPATREIGQVVRSDLKWALQTPGVNSVRQMSPIDREMRIKSAKKLSNAPLLILTTRSESSILAPWRNTVRLLVGFTSGMVLLAIFAAMMIVRKWKQQALVISAEAAKADAELARSLVETKLLREQERTAEAANRTKSNFLAMMSHEIRTPMNAVIGLTETLLDSNLSMDQRSSVEAIHLAGDNLLEILNDILDFSRLEAGSLSIEQVTFDPVSLVTTTLAIVGPSAAAKGLTLELRVSDLLPATVFGDPGRIRQVLLNLLSNAIKFTPSGGIVVKVDCDGTLNESASIHWSVTDTGMGIPADRIDALFNDFVQVDNSVSRQFGGSGLGLAICRRIAVLMGGNIVVTSELGQGSTFSLSLKLPTCKEMPWDFDDQNELINFLKECIVRLGHSPRILVVDDNDINRLVVKKMLAEFNMEVSEARDGLEAIERVSKSVYDAILMDMQMPNMDGLTATAAIRVHGGWHQCVPIIAFTANAFADDEKICLTSGMTDFLAKPVRKQQLVKALLRALALKELYEGATEFSAPAISGAPSIVADIPETDLDYFDQSRFEMLVQEIELRSATDLYALFVDDTKAKLKAFANYEISTARAVVENDAHSLRSAAGTFGFNTSAKIARSLERDASRLNQIDFRAVSRSLQAAFEREMSEFDRCNGMLCER